MLLPVAVPAKAPPVYIRTPADYFLFSVVRLDNIEHSSLHAHRPCRTRNKTSTTAVAVSGPWTKTASSAPASISSSVIDAEAGHTTGRAAARRWSVNVVERCWYPAFATISGRCITSNISPLCHHLQYSTTGPLPAIAPKPNAVNQPPTSPESPAVPHTKFKFCVKGRPKDALKAPQPAALTRPLPHLLSRIKQRQPMPPR